MHCIYCIANVYIRLSLLQTSGYWGGVGVGGGGYRGVGIVWNKVVMASHMQSSGVNSLATLPCDMGIGKLLHLLYLYSCMGLPPYMPSEPLTYC